MFASRNKADLIIEVWESLDCESVGADEILAIQRVVEERFGRPAVDSPTKIARQLADEGAVLRHSEVMELWIRWAEDRPYDPAFRNILNIDGLKDASASIRKLENLRRKYVADNDLEGLRLIRARVREARAEALARSGEERRTATERAQYAEIAEWLTLWGQSPETFETWIDLRLSSRDFKERFSDSTS
ncbi:MAG TPA: hypothetical protein PKD26_15835 [Pyrinomonadaceae bacterium]|nr:hypothetical protein [Pyrinomonadaceae bacterium]